MVGHFSLKFNGIDAVSVAGAVTLIVVVVILVVVVGVVVVVVVVLIIVFLNFRYSGWCR